MTTPERLTMLQERREYILDQQHKWADYLSNLDERIDFYKENITNKLKND